MFLIVLSLLFELLEAQYLHLKENSTIVPSLEKSATNLGIGWVAKDPSQLSLFQDSLARRRRLLFSAAFEMGQPNRAAVTHPVRPLSSRLQRFCIEH